jgi:hypothetical protein
MVDAIYVEVVVIAVTETVRVEVVGKFTVEVVRTTEGV